MQIRLVRHATLVIDMAGRRFLVDPMLSAERAMDPVAHASSDRRFPLVPLPVPVPEILQGIDAVLITHLHRDHLDQAAVELLPKGLPVICQPCDAQALGKLGFKTLLPVADTMEHQGIEFIRTGGKHGTGLIGLKMGRVSGFGLRSPGEPTLYIAGDTIWCGCVREALETLRPGVVVVNAGAAQFLNGSPITMDGADVARVCQLAPGAVVAVHMEAVNHCLLSRDGLRADLAERGCADRVRIPRDGESLSFPC